jgi:HAMP domain-containing protein
MKPEQIAELRRRLEELRRSRSKATCAGVLSSEIDVRRETEIEDLEEELRRLEKPAPGRQQPAGGQ